MNNELNPQPIIEDTASAHDPSLLESRETGEFVDRYVDLQSKAFDPRMSDEERSDIAQEIIDLNRLLEAGIGLSPNFVRDMHPQMKRIESWFLYIKKIKEGVRLLEHESAGGYLVPHVYRSTVEVLKEAEQAGIPTSVLEYFTPSIRTYLEGVKKSQGK